METHTLGDAHSVGQAPASVAEGLWEQETQETRIRADTPYLDPETLARFALLTFFYM